MSAPTKNGNGNGNGGNSLMMPISIAAGIIMTLLQAFWGVAWSGVNANLERIEKQAASRAQAIETQAAARAQIIETQFLRLREHDEFTRRLDSQIAKIETRLSEASTRTELDTRLGINSASIIQVRNEVDVLKRDLGQTYPLKEVMGNIQSRIDRIEQWSRSPPPHQQKAQ